MTFIRIVVLLNLCLLSFLYGCREKASSGEKKAGSSARTAEHINIPGTRVFIIPPDGFKPASSLPALQGGSEALIQAMDLVGGNFYIDAANISREAHEQNGVEVFEFREYELNGYPAKWLYTQADPQSRMYNLIFGDSSFSVSLMAVFPTDDKELAENIREALATVQYDKKHVVDFFATVPFKVDDSQSIFKFAHSVTSSFIYSIGGIKKDSYKGEPFMTIVAAPAEGESLQQLGDGMAGMMENRVVKNTDSMATNGYPSLKRELHGTMNGEPIYLFQHIVQIGTDAVIIQGITEKDFEKYLPEFQKLSNTVRKR